MYILLILLMIVFPFLFIDWHARMVFIACAYVRNYGHGKSWNRAHKHYKSNWSLTQRLLWFPMFKESYKNKYKIIAYFSFAHCFFTIITILFYVICTIMFPDSNVWIYEYIAYGVFFIIRFIYNNSIARGHF